MTEKVEKIQSLLNANTPFIVIQYFEWIKTMEDKKNRVYELMFIGKENVSKSIILNDEAIKILKKNLFEFKIHNGDGDGNVYDFNDFKTYAKAKNAYIG